jgi:hypothetical protein
MKKFERDRLVLESLSFRQNDLNASAILPLASGPFYHENLACVAQAMNRAKQKNAAIILMMGAHVLRDGAQRFIIDLIKRGYITCIALNGACVIHDFEFALVGATTESVARYIKDGRFGMWRETGQINDIVNATRGTDLGMGKAVGKFIFEGDFPNKETSILAQAYGNNVPATVHVSIGYDIIHQHPNFDGAATGAASYRDFLTFASQIENIEQGVVMNFGSAVMAPEVFLKALSMARNIARQDNRSIGAFTTLVCDLRDLPEDVTIEASKETDGYYFRPWKTMLIRTLMDGGKGYYVKGRHKETIPALWTQIGKLNY